MRRLKHLPFLHGCPANLTAEDKAQVIEIIGYAADVMRRYAASIRPHESMRAIAISITAGMLEYEAKVWASRASPSDYEDEDDRGSSPAFRSRQIGRA